MEKKILNKMGVFTFMMLALPLIVACGGDDESEDGTELTRVFPAFAFSEGVYWAEGYATPDFTQQRGIELDEINYSFQYEVKLVDDKKYKYEFSLTDGGKTSAYGNAEIVWVTDSKFNFTMQWNDTTKEYDIISGYFAGGKIEDYWAPIGHGVYFDGEFHDMPMVKNFTISFSGMEVGFGSPG